MESHALSFLIFLLMNARAMHDLLSNAFVEPEIYGIFFIRFFLNRISRYLLTVDLLKCLPE